MVSERLSAASEIIRLIFFNSFLSSSSDKNFASIVMLVECERRLWETIWAKFIRLSFWLFVTSTKVSSLFSASILSVISRNWAIAWLGFPSRSFTGVTPIIACTIWPFLWKYLFCNWYVSFAPLNTIFLKAVLSSKSSGCVISVVFILNNSFSE